MSATVAVTVRMPTELWERVKASAKAKDRPAAYFVRYACEVALSLEEPTAWGVAEARERNRMECEP